MVGRLADTYGKKKMIIVAAGLLGITCLWNSFILFRWMLFVGFFFGRLSGQGAMTLLPSTIIPRWFIRKRALAFSLMSIGGVIGSAIIPPINARLIDLLGWNSVWRIWAGLLFFLFIPITTHLLFDRPEKLGLRPDNGSVTEVDNSKCDFNDINSVSWTLKEAMRTRSFWGMLYCQILLPMIGTGVVFHFISILGTKGVTASSAAFILSLLAIVSFPTTFIAGYLLDKVKIHHATAFICAMEAIALIILLFSTSTVTVIIFAIIHGITLGTQSVCGGIVWPEYYGVEHLGAIRGLVMTASVIASAIGPIPFGIIFDIKGTYTPALLLMIIFPAIGFLLALLSPKPKKAQ